MPASGHIDLTWTSVGQYPWRPNDQHRGAIFSSISSGPINSPSSSAMLPRYSRNSILGVEIASANTIGSNRAHITRPASLIRIRLFFQNKPGNKFHVRQQIYILCSQLRILTTVNRDFRYRRTHRPDSHCEHKDGSQRCGNQ